MQFVEKYLKPGTVAKYNTKQSDGKPRTATKEDIEIAQSVVRHGLRRFARSGDSRQHRAGAFRPRSDERVWRHERPKTFVEWCDNQIARAIRTTDGLQGLQQNGARSAMETLAKGREPRGVL